MCEVAQQIRAQDQQNPLAEVAIGRLKKSDPLLLTVVLPVNVAFPNSPSFSPDAKDSDLLDLGWRKCLPGGCFADVALKDDFLQRWKAQSGNGRLTWKDAAGRDFAIGVSSNGLAQACSSMPSARSSKASPRRPEIVPLSPRKVRLASQLLQALIEPRCRFFNLARGVTQMRRMRRL